MSVAYVAARQLYVGLKELLDENGDPVLDESGQVVTVPDYREPGDPVPEAAAWPNVDSYISAGQIKVLSDEPRTAEGMITALVARIDQLEARIDEVLELVTKNRNDLSNKQKGKG